MSPIRMKCILKQAAVLLAFSSLVFGAHPLRRRHDGILDGKPSELGQVPPSPLAASAQGLLSDGRFLGKLADSTPANADGALADTDGLPNERAPTKRNPADVLLSQRSDNAAPAPSGDSAPAPSARSGPSGRSDASAQAASEEDDNLAMFMSGEAFDKYQEFLERRAKEKAWLQRVARGEATEEDEEFLSKSANQFRHPLRGNYNVLLWKYQVALIILGLVAVYAVEVLIDVTARKSLNFYTRISTCLWMGANFRGLGETKVVTAARCLTCAWLHAHVFHLFQNVVSVFGGWSYFAGGAGMDADNFWFYHWTFPIFMLTALFGSYYSYQTSLRYTTFSVGASGGCLGLTCAFLLMATRLEGIPAYKKPHLFLMVLALTASCIPWESIFFQTVGLATDIGAHLAGSTAGILIGLGLANLHVRWSSERLMHLADVTSIVLLVMLLLAYTEVVREYIVDGKELLIRTYVRGLGLDRNIDVDRRVTAPGRLRCELLTEEYLYLLETDQVGDDPDAIIKRLNEENAGRRKSAPELGCVSY